MSKLHDTARAFVSGTGPASSGAFTVTPDEAYSYRQRIAYRAERPDTILVSDATYSVTTSKHQNAIRNALRDAGFRELPSELQDEYGWTIYQ